MAVALINVQQMHQMLHIAFPELYEAALRNDRVWFHLSADGKPLKKFDTVPAILRLEETSTGVTILGDPSWRCPMDFDIPRSLRGSISLTKRGEPLHTFGFTGYLPSVKEGETLNVPFKAEIIQGY